ncbi:hypothetical protein N330_02636, partial [Leptosomus discolor]
WRAQTHRKRRSPCYIYKHSPSLAHLALAQELAIIPLEKEIKIYQYIDDILIRGHTIASVQTMQDRIIYHLEGISLQVPKEKIQTPDKEVKFLDIWWKGGSVCIPQDTLSAPDQIKTPENRKELQHPLGLLIFWRKHIADFSIIAQPLYDLLRKGKTWNWSLTHDKALQLLIFEANTHHTLGPIHPTDP